MCDYEIVNTLYVFQVKEMEEKLLQQVQEHEANKAQLEGAWRDKLKACASCFTFLLDCALKRLVCLSFYGWQWASLWVSQ
jgi:hypothetical protein